MPGRIHSGDSSIDKQITTLKVLGNFKADQTIGNRNSGTVYIKGDTNIDGVVDVIGSLVINGKDLSDISTTSLTLPNGFDGAVLTSDANGVGVWKTKFWKDIDVPQGITNPASDSFYTTHSVAIGITTPDEKLHVNVTETGGGAQIGSAMIGNDLVDANNMVIVNSALKLNSTDYALKQEDSGETHINSSTSIDFRISNQFVGTVDSSGNFGIGVTTPTELLHVGGNAIVEGNLTVNGNFTAINSSIVEIEDANILLGKNNTADTIDGGVLTQYVDSGVTKFAGIFRDADSTNKHWELFQQLEEKPTTTINTVGTGYERASLRVDGLDVQSGISFSQTDSNINHNGLAIIGNEPQIFLDITGNMGIGVTNPTNPLDVNGNINTNEVYQIDNQNVFDDKNTLATGVTDSSLENLGTLLSLHVTGETILDGDTTINGFLNVLGGVTFNNSVDVSITQPFLKLATGNVADLLDTGFYAQYVEGGVTKFAGMFRDASDSGRFKLFEGITGEPDPDVVLDGINGNLADLHVRELDVFGRINITDHYEIQDIQVLTADTLGVGVTQSSLETVGTLQSLNISGDLTVDTNTLYVDSTGNNVGIGTTNPNNQLDVTGNGASIGALSLNANGDSDLIIKQSTGNNIDFQDGTGSELMVLTSSGFLGIGITNPTSQIHTSGNVDVGGDVVVQGNITVNGTVTTINSDTVTIDDGMIKLADGNVADTADSGIYSLYNDGTTKFAGMFRDASDSGIVRFYEGLEVEPGLTVDVGATGFDYANIQAKSATLDEIKYTSSSTDLTFTNSGSTRAVLTPAGFLGVGTTAEYPLHVSKINSSNWSGRFTNSATEVFIANSSGNGMTINSGVDNTNTSVNLNVRNTTTNNVLAVRNDDKVGILTSAPDKTFHVNIGTTGDGAKLGNAFVGNWANTASHATFAHDDFSQVGESYAIKQNSAGETEINAASGQEVHININENQVITVTSGENVGIGVTNPTNKFEVSGNSTMTADSSNTLTLNNTLTTVSLANADGSGILTDSTTTSNYGLSIRESGTALFQVNNDGTVGIGVTNPAAELEVRDTIRVSNSNGDTLDINAATNNLTIDANDLLTFGVNGSALVNIDTSDNVGIGTATPQADLHLEGTQYISTSLGIGITGQSEALHVVGDGKVTGDFTIGGNLIFEGVAVDGLAIQDPLIKLASNNTDDLVDSGLYSMYQDTGVTKFTGLFRDASDKKWNLFHELEVEPGVTVDKTATGFDHATLILDTLEFNTDIVGPLINITQINSDNITNTALISTQTLGVTGNTTMDGTLEVIGDFTVNGVDQTFHIDTTGDNVGIGTTNPTEKLEVNGNVLIDGSMRTTDSLIKLAHTNSADTLDSGFYSQYNDGTDKYNGLFRDTTDSKFRLFTGLEVEPTTTVDIGATGYTNTTLVVDILEADTEVIAPEFTATCDMRVKENIKKMDVSNCLEKISNIGLYEYNYIEEFNKSDAKLYGLIAQDVEKVMPEAIKTKSMRFGNTKLDDFKAISQNTVMANMIGAIQFQQKLIYKLYEKLDMVNK